jgi:hypothetical protein
MMKKPALTVLAFILVSFGVQGLSHFVINVDHFAAITFMRPEPVLPMGFAAMIIEALIFSFVMSRLWPDGATIQQGLIVSACFGLFLASYIVLAEPAKYAAPSIPSWMVIEGMASLIQFAVFGVLLGLIYRKKPSA